MNTSYLMNHSNGGAEGESRFLFFDDDTIGVIIVVLIIMLLLLSL